MKEQIEQYIPYNEQEQKDQRIMLEMIDQKDVLTRQNEIGHFTVSAWVVNHDKTKVLMCYHKIYKSLSWLGGHVDGNNHFCEVALKEVHEESGLKRIRLLDDSIFSLEILTVNGHRKNNQYVSSHLHYNITYLIKNSFLLNWYRTYGVGYGALSLSVRLPHGFCCTSSQAPGTWFQS